MNDDPQTARLTPPIDDPLKVQLVEADDGVVPRMRDERSVSPDTTKEQDLSSADARAEEAIGAEATRANLVTRLAQQARINFIWEFTQSYVAVMVVTATSFGVFIGRVILGSETPFPSEWWTIVGLVIGFYFGRTNHARIGDNPDKKANTSRLDDR